MVVNPDASREGAQQQSMQVRPQCQVERPGNEGHTSMQAVPQCRPDSGACDPAGKGVQPSTQAMPQRELEQPETMIQTSESARISSDADHPEQVSGFDSNEESGSRPGQANTTALLGPSHEYFEPVTKGSKFGMGPLAKISTPSRSNNRLSAHFVRFTTPSRSACKSYDAAGELSSEGCSPKPAGISSLSNDPGVSCDDEVTLDELDTRLLRRLEDSLIVNKRRLQHKVKHHCSEICDLAYVGVDEDGSVVRQILPLDPASHRQEELPLMHVP